MKYLSIDIETTGLDPQTDQVVEFAAVLDDLYNPTPGVPIEHLPSFRALIYRERYTIDSYCIGLHRELFAEISSRKDQVASPEDIFSGVSRTCQKSCVDFVCHPGLLAPAFADWLTFLGFPKGSKNRIKINAAGKNFGTFDKNFLESSTGDICFDQYIDVRHRVIDVGMVFSDPQDEMLPSTDVCLLRAGLPVVLSHRALDDARNVVGLCRFASNGLRSMWEGIKADRAIKELVEKK